MVSTNLDVERKGQRRHTVENKVKLESVWLGPVLVARVDEVVSTKLLCISFLFLGMRDGEDFGTKSMCPHQSEVTQTSDTDDANFFSWPAAQSDKGRIRCQASAQHRSCNGSVEVLGNLENEVFLYANVGREATLGNNAIVEFGAIRVDSKFVSQLCDVLIGELEHTGLDSNFPGRLCNCRKSNQLRPERQRLHDRRP